MKQPSRDTAMWFAVQVRSRSEKAVLTSLQKQGIHAYLPLISTHRIHGTRKRVLDLPLISNYVFVLVTYRDYIPVLQTRHVVEFVRFGGDINPIPQQEIDLLTKVCQDSSLEVIIAKSSYTAGDAVQVIDGPLKGTIGKLRTIQGSKNLIVELKNFGHALEVVQIRPQYLRKIG